MKNFIGFIGNCIFFLLLGGIVVVVFVINWLVGNECCNILCELCFQYLVDCVEQIVQVVDDILLVQCFIVLQVVINFGFEVCMVEDMNDVIGFNVSISLLIEMLQVCLGEDCKIVVQCESECLFLCVDDGCGLCCDICCVIYISLYDQVFMCLCLYQLGELFVLCGCGLGGLVGLFGL